MGCREAKNLENWLQDNSASKLPSSKKKQAQVPQWPCVQVPKEQNDMKYETFFFKRNEKFLRG